MLLETLVHEVTVPNNMKGTNRRWTLKGIYDSPSRRFRTPYYRIPALFVRQRK